MLLVPRQSHNEKEQVMRESTMHVGLDVHKDSISVALACADGQVVEMGAVPNTPKAVRELVQRLSRRSVRWKRPCPSGLWRRW